MTIPATFRKKGERTITTQSYIDIAKKQAYILLYGGQTNTGGSDAYILSNITFWSNDILTVANYENGNTVLDLDFDMKIDKTPIIVEGVGIVTIPYLQARTTDVAAASMYAKAWFRHYDGTTETEVASGQGETDSGDNIFTARGVLKAIQFTIPKTKFKAGDTLRLTITVYTAGAAGNGYAGIGHDPKNREMAASDTTPSVLQFHLPIRMDL